MSGSPADVRHEVENLLGRYAEYADDRDVGGVTELFHDAVVSFAGTILGTADEVSGHYGRIFAAAPPSRHLLTNIIVDPAGSTATARCRYSRWAIEADARLLALGDYRATFTRTDGSWKFTSFEVSRAWQA